MEHRFRGIKLQADLIRRLVALGEDPGLYEELPGIRTKEGKTSRRSPPPAPAPASLRRRQPCPCPRRSSFRFPWRDGGCHTVPSLRRQVPFGERQMLT